jgi:hypothetical protein
MNGLGQRYWPVFGAAYCIVAVKKVRGMRMLSPAWKAKPKMAAAPVSISSRSKPEQAPSAQFEQT